MLDAGMHPYSVLNEMSVHCARTELACVEHPSTGPDHNRTWPVSVIVRCDSQPFTRRAECRTKQESKRVASADLIIHLKE
jgi:hypothetical protein